MKFLENEPLSKHTSFRVGGPARWFVEGKSLQDVQEAIAFAREKGIPWFTLGGGTNTLVADKGFDGLVIKMSNRDVLIEGERMIVGAGTMSVLAARAAADAGLSGLEWAASLPGTIGGAVRGNAGCFGGEMKDVVETVQTFEKTMNRADLAFGYRDSAIKHSKEIILDVTFRLARGDKVEIKKKMDDIMAMRKVTQPIASGTAGCAFKNPLVDGKLMSCGKIIDELGLKGMKIGGMRISPIHGNFLVNDGTATADDVVQMIAFVKSRARDALGIQLQEEIEYLGF